MTLKRTFTIAVAAASIFGGALVAIPLLASAQDDASLFESETNKEESNNQGKRKDKDHGPKRGAFIGEILLEVGLDADIVKEGFAIGQTLGETAEANGINSETIVDAIVTAMTERLNQAVTDGKLTPEEAAEKAAGIPDRATEIVNTVPERKDNKKDKGLRNQSGFTKQNQSSSI